MQNLVFLMGQPDGADDISLKGGIMCMNRFCIDEDAAFELTGVWYIKKSYNDISSSIEAKGKDYSSLQ